MARISQGFGVARIEGDNARAAGGQRRVERR